MNRARRIKRREQKGELRGGGGSVAHPARWTWLRSVTHVSPTGRLRPRTDGVRGSWLRRFFHGRLVPGIVLGVVANGALIIVLAYIPAMFPTSRVPELVLQVSAGERGLDELDRMAQQIILLPTELEIGGPMPNPPSVVPSSGVAPWWEWSWLVGRWRLTGGSPSWED